jgi:hypothetical protein
MPGLAKDDKGVKAAFARRRRMREQAKWLAEKLLNKEPDIHTVKLTGQNHNFADITCYGSGGREVPCSVKHNSREVAGHRIRQENIDYLPFPGELETSPQYRNDIQSILWFLEDQKGRYSKNVPPQRTIAEIVAVTIIEKELRRRQDLIQIFRAALGHTDHYLLIGGSDGAMIDGYNFHGSLNCRKIPLPQQDVVIETRGSVQKPLHIISLTSSGFTLQWRSHMKSNIKPGAFGGSLTVRSVPTGFYREQQ